MIHPLTGEVLPDELGPLERAEAETDEYLREEYSALRRLRDGRDVLRVRIAELRGRAPLPARRRRSVVQERVARCPRCGEHPEGKVESGAEDSASTPDRKGVRTSDSTGS